MGSLSNDGSQVSAPPSGEGAGSSATARPATPTDSDPAVASTAASAIQNKPPAEELSLGSIGLVFALPGSSYFSNYEVFVAQIVAGKNRYNSSSWSTCFFLINADCLNMIYQLAAATLTSRHTRRDCNELGADDTGSS